MLLKISQNSKEKAAGFRPTAILKKTLRHRCFTMNFAKFLKIRFLQNIFGQLLLYWIKTVKYIEKQNKTHLVAASVSINYCCYYYYYYYYCYYYYYSYKEQCRGNIFWNKWKSLKNSFRRVFFYLKHCRLLLHNIN